MKKMVLFLVAGYVLLFFGGLVARSYVFAPWERHLAEPATPAQKAGASPDTMSWKSYKKVKLALGSFDLVNGLTKAELETMPQDNRAFGFYFLLASLGLIIGLRGKPAKP